MGIHSLNPFLDKKMRLPRVREISLINFSGQIIAFDGNYWAYTCISVANKEITQGTNVGTHDPDREAIMTKWFSLALETVCTFLSHGVTPVFVFDGTHLVEKAVTQTKRKEDKLKMRKEIEQLQTELRNASPLDRDPVKIERLKQLLSSTNYIASDELKRLLELLTGLGIPVLHAVGDAEQLCSAMAKEGLVSAVFSADTDTLVYGCPLTITSMGRSYYVEEKNRSFRKVTCVYLNDILEDLEWDQETFVDFCITLGCDFNTRIFRLGPVAAFNLIQEHGKIDNYPPNIKIADLKPERCREIFQHKPPVHVIEGDELAVDEESLRLDKNLLFLEGQEFLQTYSLESYFHRLHYLYTNIPDKPQGKIPSLPKRRVILIKKKVVNT